MCAAIEADDALVIPSRKPTVVRPFNLGMKVNTKSSLRIAHVPPDHQKRTVKSISELLHERPRESFNCYCFLEVQL